MYHLKSGSCPDLNHIDFAGSETILGFLNA